MTPNKILAAIDATFASSPVPPTSGDIAAAVLRAMADAVWDWTADDLNELADQLDGALSFGEASPGLTDAELDEMFRAWWAQSWPTPPGTHAMRTHTAWARHLLDTLNKQPTRSARDDT